MNLNYENLNLDGISEDVRAKYAFPENKEYLRRYMKGGSSLMTKDERRARSNENLKIAGLTTVSFAGGIYGYMCLINPAGKVLRDAYDASLPMWRRVARRVLPFGLLTIPFVWHRQLLDDRNFNYRD